MSVESAYPSFPPTPFTAEPVEGINSNVGGAAVDFEQIRNAFEAPSLTAINPIPKFPIHPQPNSFQGNASSNYESYNYGTGDGMNGNGEYASSNPYGDRPPPFHSQQLQPEPTFSNPTSPYLSAHQEGFPSPNSGSNGGSNYQYDQAQGQTSPNLYSTGMNSPNLYGNNPYANNFATGFNGGMSNSGFLLPGMLPTSPGLGPMSPQFGMGGFPMMSTPSGMIPNTQAVSLLILVSNLDRAFY